MERPKMKIASFSVFMNTVASLNDRSCNKHTDNRSVFLNGQRSYGNQKQQAKYNLKVEELCNIVNIRKTLQGSCLPEFGVFLIKMIILASTTLAVFVMSQ